MSFNMLHSMLRTVQHLQPCPGLDRQAIKPAVPPYNDCGLHYDRQESSNKARSTRGVYCRLVVASVRLAKSLVRLVAE